MTGKDLFHGMGFVEDRLINEAENTASRKSVYPKILRWTAMAACLCAAFTIAWMWRDIPDDSKAIDNVSQTTEKEDIKEAQDVVSSNQYGSNGVPQTEIKWNLVTEVLYVDLERYIPEGAIPVTYENNAQAFAVLGGVILPETLGNDLRLQESSHEVFQNADDSLAAGASSMWFFFRNEADDMRVVVTAEKTDQKQTLDIISDSYSPIGEIWTVEDVRVSRVNGSQVLFFEIAEDMSLYAKFQISVQTSEDEEYITMTVFTGDFGSKEAFQEIIAEIITFSQQ